MCQLLRWRRGWDSCRRRSRRRKRNVTHVVDRRGHLRTQLVLERFQFRLYHTDQFVLGYGRWPFAHPRIQFVCLPLQRMVRWLKVGGAARDLVCPLKRWVFPSGDTDSQPYIWQQALYPPDRKLDFVLLCPSSVEQPRGIEVPLVPARSPGIVVA